MGFLMLHRPQLVAAGAGLPMLDGAARASAGRRYGTAVTDALFMTSRDGLLFAGLGLIRPAREREAVYGDNLSSGRWSRPHSHRGRAQRHLYATESWEGTSTRLGATRSAGRLRLAYAPWPAARS